MSTCLLLLPVIAGATTVLDNGATAIYDFRGGITAWNSSTTYHKYNWVIYGGSTWKSLQNENLDHVPSEGRWWTQETHSFFPIIEWSARATYGSGEWVYLISGGTAKYYQSRQGSNTGNNPASSPSRWQSGRPPVVYLDLFSPVKGWPIRWELWLGGVGALNGDCGSNQWAEEEVDADLLGPAVRVNKDNDTMYFASVQSEGAEGEGTIYIRVYRRKDGTNTLLHSFTAGHEYDYTGPQAAKLGVEGDPPVLHVAVRRGVSGTGAGYDPFELQIQRYPWVYLGSYTDTDNEKLTDGVPGFWNPVRSFNPSDPLFSAEHTTHWSYYCEPMPPRRRSQS